MIWKPIYVMHILWLFFFFCMSFLLSYTKLLVVSLKCIFLCAFQLRPLTSMTLIFIHSFIAWDECVMVKVLTNWQPDYTSINYFYNLFYHCFLEIAPFIIFANENELLLLLNFTDPILLQLGIIQLFYFTFKIKCI